MVAKVITVREVTKDLQEVISKITKAKQDAWDLYERTREEKDPDKEALKLYWRLKKDFKRLQGEYKEFTGV